MEMLSTGMLDLKSTESVVPISGGSERNPSWIRT
jgi:hypothetical protein